jgi:hypothetical protein
MKLFRLKKVRILLCLVVVIIAGYILQKIKYNCEVPIYQIYSCLKLYIQENKGVLPASQEELMKKGYLRVEANDRGKYYSVRCDLIEIVTRLPTENKNNPEFWIKISFTNFFIRYGILKDDFVVRNNTLYDKTTGEKVLLFTGPWSSVLSGTYNTLSVALYNEIE